MSFKFLVFALLAAVAVAVPTAEPCTACDQVHLLRSRVKMLETQIMELNTLAADADGEETCAFQFLKKKKLERKTSSFCFVIGSTHHTHTHTINTPHTHTQ